MKDRTDQGSVSFPLFIFVRLRVFLLMQWKWECALNSKKKVNSKGGYWSICKINGTDGSKDAFQR
jgi:hypothetical protein